MDLDKHVLVRHEKPLFECNEFGCNFSTESLYMMKKVIVILFVVSFDHLYIYFAQHDDIVHYNIHSIYCCHCCPKRYKKGHQLSGHLIKMHKFQLASGHSRFAYRQDLDGCFRLQTVRIESLEVSQQIMARNPNDTFPIVPMPDDMAFSCAPIEQNEQGHLCMSVQLLNSDQDDTEIAPQGAAALTMPDLHYRPSSESLPNDDENNATGGGRKLRSKSKVDENVTSTSVAMMASSVVVSSSSAAAASAKRNDSNKGTTSKGIEEFSMMKRYLDGAAAAAATAAINANNGGSGFVGQTKSHIFIEVNDIDADGKLITREVVRANEFLIKNWSCSLYFHQYKNVIINTIRLSAEKNMQKAKWLWNVLFNNKKTKNLIIFFNAPRLDSILNFIFLFQTIY